MRRQAKAPSAFTSGRSTMLALALAFLWLFAIAPAAMAAKSIGGFVGGSAGSLGAQFQGPRDVAVNHTGAGAADAGDIYLTDQSNNRVQVLDANGNFKFALGRDVISFGKPGDLGDVFEICTIAADCKGGNGLGLGGALNNPQGIVVNQVSGDVYVRDRDNRRVQQFDAAGNFIRAWGWDVVQTGGVGDDTIAPINEFEICTVASQCQGGSTGFGAGQFLTSSSSGAGLALSPATGDLFVADPGNRRINQYEPDGDFVRAWGYGVDTGANNQFQVCTTASVCQAGVAPGTANANGSFATSNPLHLAVDSQNVVYASDTASSTVANRIIRFDVDGAPVSGDAGANLLQPINPTTGPAFPPAPNPLLAGPTQGLEIDPDTDGGGADEESLYVVRDPSSGNTVAQELDVPTDSGGGELPADNVTVVATHTFAAASVNGIGLNPLSGNAYLPTTVNPSPGNGIYVLSETPGALAAPTLNPVANVTPTTADASGSLDPKSGVVSYLFEVSPDGVVYTPAGVKRYVSGSGATPASTTITGLDPNTTYRVRLTATKQTGLSTATVLSSSEAIFLTDAAPPEALTLPSGPRTDTATELRGTVDPNGTATDYWFEYGGNIAYGTKVPLSPAPAGSGNQPLFVAEQVSGLLPSTTYHYRVVADGFGAPVNGADMTFTTQPTPASQPALGERAYELVSPADKVGGIGVGTWLGGPTDDAKGMGFAAYEGERFAAQGSQGSLLLGEAAQAYANDWAFADRVSDTLGWQSHTPLTHPAPEPAPTRFVEVHAASDDLSRLAWRTNNEILGVFPEAAKSAGWPDGVNPSFISSWAGRWEIFGPTDPSTQLSPNLTLNGRMCDLVFSADVSTSICSTDLNSNNGKAGMHGLAGPGDPTRQGAPDLVAGRTVYLADTSGEPADSFADTGARTLVNVCADGTALPSVAGGGDLEAQACPAPIGASSERLVSERGATVLSGDVGEDLKGTRRNVVSSDGSRIFFMSPDPLASGVPNGTNAFCSGSGPTTTCPTQLFVRQRNDDGSVTTRWISRAAPGLFGTQDATLTGTVRFEGASTDGDKVLFRTNSPLTADDPNGTGAPAPPGGIKTGSASNFSWDLYLYDFPDVPSADPGGGSLTRVSAGPSGEADCNVQPNGSDGAISALRFLSDDAGRAYFTCAAPLPGTPPPGGGTVTAPGGSPTTSDATNLYVYNAGLPASERWRFVARIPRGNNEMDCASKGASPQTPTGGGNQFQADANCFRGTQDGEFVTFWTPGRLTGDDPDATTSDIYAYDADADTLHRITATQGGIGGSYFCIMDFAGTPANEDSVPCHGDGGFDLTDGAVDRAPKSILGLATDPLVPGDRLAFFQSKSRLVAEDADFLYDVYQWRNGELSLLTPGTEFEPVYYRGNDATGRNVYFASKERLTWQDYDAVWDVYTARVDGGIPEPLNPPACDVLGDGCQGALSSPPATQPSSSASFSGQGNLLPPEQTRRCGKGKVRRGGKCVARKSKKRQRAKRRAGTERRAGR